MARVLLLLALVAGCGAPANTALLPVGSRCENNEQCGTTPYECQRGMVFPGGYCDRTCTLDADCPADAVCAPTALQGAPLRCRRRCSDDTGCRLNEGYHCIDAGASTLVCDRPR